MPPGVLDEAARPVLWDVGSDVGRRHEGRSEIDSSSAGHMMFNLDVLKKMAMLSAAPVIYDLRGAKAGVVNIGVLPTWGTKPRSNMEEEREEGKATKAENPLVYLAVLCCGWGWFLTKVLLNGVWISGDCPIGLGGGGPGEGTAKWGPDLGRLPPPRGGAVAKMRWKRALLRGGGPPNRRNAAKKSVFWGGANRRVTVRQRREMYLAPGGTEARPAGSIHECGGGADGSGDSVEGSRVQLSCTDYDARRTAPRWWLRVSSETPDRGLTRTFSSTRGFSAGW